MKRRFRFLAVVALLLAAVMLLSACKDKDGNESLSIAGDYDAAQIEAKLNEMKTDGIYVKVSITGQSDGEAAETEYFAYGAKGEVYYFMYGEDDDQVYLDLSNADYCVVYDCEKDNGSLVWTKTVTHYNSGFNKDTMKQQAEAMAAGVWTWFGYYAGATGEGTKTTATMLGRTCDKYVMKQSAVTFGAAGKVDCEYWIDQATGVCLKYAVFGTAVTGEGTASGSFAMEATEFRTTWTPALPTAATTVVDGTTQSGGSTGGFPGGYTGGGSGEGGSQGGEDPGNTAQTSPFLGKRLTVTSASTDPQNAAMEASFANGYVQLYSDLNFECISDFGCLLGNYVAIGNANTGTAYLNTAKIYSEGAYDYETAESMGQLQLSCSDGAYTLTFEIEVGTDLYEIMLELEDAGAVQAHDDTVCPLDPNGYGFDPFYQVSQETWDAFVSGEYLFLDNNFTVDFTVTPPAGVAREGTLKVDDTWINDGDQLAYDRTSSVKDNEGLYAFDCYAYNGVEWAYMDNADYGLDLFDVYNGAVAAPFMRASYNTTGHYYFINAFTYTPYGSGMTRDVQNYRIWFSNGLVQRITFTSLGESFEYVYSDWGNTVAEISLP